MLQKRLTAIILAAVIAGCACQPAWATTLSNAKNQKVQAESSLSDTEAKISQIEQQQASLQKEIDAVGSDLVQVLMDLDIINDEISAKKVELAQAEADLQAAKEKEATQYEDMKQRIRYMYENSGDSYLEAFVGAKNFADILNKVENFTKVYDYDRNLLVEYQNTKEEVSTLIDQVKEEQAELEENQEAYERRQSDLEALKSSKSKQMSGFNSELKNAKSLASQYKQTIKEQNDVIAAEVAKEKEVKVTAGASNIASNALKSNVSAVTVAKTEAKEEKNTSKKSETTALNNAASTDSGKKEDKQESKKENNQDSKKEETKPSQSASKPSEDTKKEDSSQNSTSSSSKGDGAAVVAFACQFVGNPYVWGGESLTNGADCSGFIMSVYRHFGVSLPHSSEAMRSCGRSVSILDIQPGDIVCYSGHVAIYMGGGKIVHASSPETGIKISSNFQYKTVLAVRRVL